MTVLGFRAVNAHPPWEQVEPGKLKQLSRRSQHHTTMHALMQNAVQAAMQPAFAWRFEGGIDVRTRAWWADLCLPAAAGLHPTICLQSGHALAAQATSHAGDQRNVFRESSVPSLGGPVWTDAVRKGSAFDRPAFDRLVWTVSEMPLISLREDLSMCESQAALSQQQTEISLVEGTAAKTYQRAFGQFNHQAKLVCHAGPHFQKQVQPAWLMVHCPFGHHFHAA